MKVELEKTFPMPAAPEVAWAFLQDIEGVAGCMPGAKIIERIDPTHFKGTVAVRVGPASMAFKGDIEVLELDATQHMLHLLGKGSDTTGSSGASMDLVARIEPAAEGLSQLVGRSEVTMSGKAAAFGGRMMGSVADQILKQFAGNFAARVQVLAAAGAANATPAVPGATAAGTAAANVTDSGASAAGTAVTNATAPGASAASTVATNVTAPSASAVGTAATNAASPGASAAGTTAAANVAAPGASAASAAAGTAATNTPAPELNALALFWAIIRDWFRGLFRRRAA